MLAEVAYNLFIDAEGLTNNQLIKYKIRSGKIKNIYTAGTSTESDKEIYKSTNTETKLFFNDANVFGRGEGSPILINNNTKKFFIPPNKEARALDNYSYTEQKLVAEASYNVEAYNMNEMGMAEAVIIRTESGGSRVASVDSYRKSFLLVKKVVDGIDDDDEPVKYVTYYYEGAEKTSVIDKNTAFKYEQDDNKKINAENIHPGDVLCAEFRETGEFNDVYKMHPNTLEKVDKAEPFISFKYLWSDNRCYGQVVAKDNQAMKIKVGEDDYNVYNITNQPRVYIYETNGKIITMGSFDDVVGLDTHSKGSYVYLKCKDRVVLEIVIFKYDE